MNISAQWTVISRTAFIQHMLHGLRLCPPGMFKRQARADLRAHETTDGNHHSYYSSSPGNWAPQEPPLTSSIPKLFYLKISPFLYAPGPPGMEGEEGYSGVRCLPASERASCPCPQNTRLKLFYLNFPFIYFCQLHTFLSPSKVPTEKGLERRSTAQASTCPDSEVPCLCFYLVDLVAPEKTIYVPLAKGHMIISELVSFPRGDENSTSGCWKGR